MKKFATILFAVILFFDFAYSANMIGENVIVGQYWSPEKDGKIEIYAKGNKFFGKITWSKNPRKDTHNPNPSLRNREVVGMTFLSDFVYDDGEWVDGTIYDPKTGKTYNCNMWLENGNLKVRGYIGFSLLGRTETFERIQ